MLATVPCLSGGQHAHVRTYLEALALRLMKLGLWQEASAVQACLRLYP